MGLIVARPHTLIPLFITVKLRSEVLNSFLVEALSKLEKGQNKISIVSDIPEAASTPKVSTPPIEITQFPFVGYAERQLREIIASQERLTDEAFIILDEQTLHDGRTCRLVNRKQAHYFSVRSDFRGAQRRLDAILNESTNMQRLRNEAAMNGGILGSDQVPTKHMAEMQTAVSFRNRPTTEKTWETCCKPHRGFQPDALIPVFCTAELPLKTLNAFIGAANNPPYWPDDALAKSHIRIMGSLDLSLLASPTKGPYETLPAFPFLRHTPQSINNTVQSQLPGTALNCVLFVILDEFSAETGTCIIAENMIRDDPFLMLVRVEFCNAMAVPVSTTVTGMSFEGSTLAAMLKDGVNRF